MLGINKHGGDKALNELSDEQLQDAETLEKIEGEVAKFKKDYQQVS